MKAKRLVALLLALVMIVGIISVSAAAYTCAYCGSSNNHMYDEGSPIVTASRRVEGCGKKSGTHIHQERKTPRYMICDEQNCRREFMVYKYESDVCA